MEISREQFDAQVSRLERVAARAPRAYKLRVVLLGALGYAYLLAGLLLLLAVLGGLALLASTGRGAVVAVKLGLPLLLLVFAVGRALWVQLPPPEGRELPRGPETEALWAEVEAVRQKLGGPVIHTLLLDDEFNAGIVQLPRFGLLGPTKNYLKLGLPLMQALSPEQFRSVLAHEFGHLSGAHGRMSAWVYRVRRTWGQVHEALEQMEGWGVAIFTRFFRWYAPFYSAYSFVLARANEYEADRASVDVVGSATAAEALVSVQLRHAQLEERFWGSMNERATREPEPAHPYTEMTAALRSELEPTLARRWFTAALARTTDSTDTHPSLRDRLAALGEEPRPPEGRLERSAAEVLLGAALPTFASELDGGWRASVAERWTKAYGRAQEGRKRLAELEARGPDAPLSVAESWERASLTEDLRDAAASVPLYQQVLALEPGHAGAHFALGRLLLARGEEVGLGHLEEAMKLDTDAILPGCGRAMAWLEEHGRGEEARVWLTRGETWARTLHESREERDSLRKSDTFEPHGVPEEILRVVAEQLHGYSRVKDAWLVRKSVKHFQERPLYVLGVGLAGGWGADEANRQLIAELSRALELPGEAFIVNLSNGDNAELSKRLRKVADTPFYERKRFALAAA